MGGCCVGETKDEEINKANDISDIINIFKERKNKLPEEKKQIIEHLQDQTKEIKSFDVNGIDKEILKKRILFLDDLEEAYSFIIDILQNNTNLPLKETKSYCENIAAHYFLIYDPNGELQKDVEKLEEFSHETN
jgi:hypothetical protein